MGRGRGDQESPKEITGRETREQEKVQYEGEERSCSLIILTKGEEGDESSKLLPKLVST